MGGREGRCKEASQGGLYVRPAVLALNAFRWGYSNPT